MSKIEFTHLQNAKGEWEPTHFQPEDFLEIKAAILGVDFVPLFGEAKRGIYVATQENGVKRVLKGIENGAT